MSEPIKSTINPWMPEADPVKLAALGKLGEEAAELASRAMRCIIQGIDELDPDTGRPNYDELEREIADVQACIAVVELHFKLTHRVSRMNDKLGGFRRWHAMIRAALAATASGSNGGEQG